MDRLLIQCSLPGRGSLTHLHARSLRWSRFTTPPTHTHTHPTHTHTTTLCPISPASVRIKVRGHITFYSNGIHNLTDDDTESVPITTFVSLFTSQLQLHRHRKVRANMCGVWSRCGFSLMEVGVRSSFCSEMAERFSTTRQVKWPPPANLACEHCHDLAFTSSRSVASY